MCDDLSDDAAEQFVRFLERIVPWDWQIQTQALGIAFRARSLRVLKPGGSPKRMRTSVFFLRPTSERPRLVFPLPGQWSQVVGFDPTPYTDRLQALGCVIGWKESQLDLHLREQNSAEMFDQLYRVLQDIVADMKRSLSRKE
jgi:hypothetical protein